MTETASVAAVDQQDMAQSLCDCQERLASIFNGVQAGILIIDAQTHRIVDVNSVAAKMIALEPEKIVGRNCREFVCSRPQMPCPMDEPGRTEFTAETFVKTADGRAVPILKRVVSVTLCGKRHIIDSFMDITDLKHAEAEARLAHAQTEQFFSAIQSILIGLSQDQRVIKWNAAAQRTLGIGACQVMHRPVQECSISWDSSRVIDGLDQCRRSNCPVRVDDLRFTRPDGKDGFLGLTISPLLAEDGQASGYLVIGADVTERKILQSQLTQALKLESIGQLAAGIAHEINTPMQYVGDNTRFLGDSFANLLALLGRISELAKSAQSGTAAELAAELAQAVSQADMEYLSQEIPQAIKQSLEGIDRVTKIVRAMREFSHRDVQEKVATDINKCIESTITVARNEWKYVAEMETDYDQSLPPVPCLPGEFNQVILNLVINAAHAIADVVGDGSQQKGKIRISTRQNGDWVEVRVSDTGTGIPEKIKARVFDPFFTTKEVGKGTGQGLAISRSVIVEKHKGHIDFETEAGKGTTFIVRLPVKEAAGEGRQRAVGVIGNE